MSISPPTPRQYRAASPVPGILPVAGYTLVGMDEDDCDGFTTPLYFARRDGDGAPFAMDFPLHTSRFGFHPTQERFAWLVANGFRPAERGGWTDAEIDAAIAGERIAA